jgi:hypothetical protein
MGKLSASTCGGANCSLYARKGFSDYSPLDNEQGSVVRETRIEVRGIPPFAKPHHG